MSGRGGLEEDMTDAVPAVSQKKGKQRAVHITRSQAPTLSAQREACADRPPLTFPLPYLSGGMSQLINSVLFQRSS